MRHGPRLLEWSLHPVRRAPAGVRRIERPTRALGVGSAVRLNATYYFAGGGVTTGALGADASTVICVD